MEQATHPFYVRFQGASTGRKVVTTGKVRAGEEFARLEGVPYPNAYISVCPKPTPGVVYAS